MGIGNKRASFVNYRKPGIFMITFGKHEAAPVFSTLRRTYFNDKYKGITVDYTPYGWIIHDEIRKEAPVLMPKIQFLQYVVMPDHLHFIISIKEELEHHLDYYMDLLKRNIYDNAVKRGLKNDAWQYIFKHGYNDQYLTHKRNLGDMYTYLLENPYRRWEIKMNPDFFTKIEEGSIFGNKCQYYGNMHLLQNPFIYPVVIHSSYSEEQKRKLAEIWTYASLNGGVLAGAFINKEEKKFRDLAYDNGGKIIYFRNHRFERKEKPGGELFKACKTGRMLVVNPDFPEYFERPKNRYGQYEVTKQQSRFMNAIIEKFDPPSADKTR